MSRKLLLTLTSTAQNDVSRLLAAHVLRAAIPELHHIHPLEQSFAGTEEHRRDGEMELIDKASAKKLLDRRDPTADADVLAARRCPGLLERGLDSVRNEIEGGLTLHDNRIARVVRQHIDGHVIGRLFSPPTLPGVVRPRPTHRPEHVSSHDPGSDILEAARGEALVNAG